MPPFCRCGAPSPLPSPLFGSARGAKQMPSLRLQLPELGEPGSGRGELQFYTRHCKIYNQPLGKRELGAESILGVTSDIATLINTQ